MSFNQLFESKHNKYVKFDIKVTKGPESGKHSGYKESIDVYFGTINGRHVKFLFDSEKKNVAYIDTYDSFWYGEEAKLYEQALDAIKSYNPKPFLTSKALDIFNDLIDEL